MIELLLYLGLAMTFASGYIILSYKNYARQRGWPVSDVFDVEAGVLKLHGSACMIVPTALTYFAFEWWSPFTVILLGFFLGFFATQLFRSRVQSAAMLTSVPGIFLCMAWGFMMIAEL